jgi:MYXO-CTERM domain-containing protein
LLALALASVVVTTPRLARACICGDRPSVTEAVVGAEAVFVGELVAESELEWSRDAYDRAQLDYDPSESVASYFVVTRVFVGDLRVGERVRVLNAVDTSSCDRGGYGELGRSWLLLVWGSSGKYEGGNRCSVDRVREPNALLLRKVERAVTEWNASEGAPPRVRRHGCQAAREDASHGAWSLALLLGLVAARRRRRAIHSRACRSSTPSSPTPPRCMPRSS